MKKIFLLVLLIFILGCAAIPGLPKYKPTKELAVGRGIRMEFMQNMPPSEIKGPFRVALKFTNNNPFNIVGTLSLRDITTAKGFEDVTQQVYLEPAIVEYSDVPDPKTGEFKIKSFMPIQIPLDFGTVRYENVLPGTTTQFIAEFDFDYSSTLNSQLCVASFGSRQITCPDQEIFSSARLGLENQFSPISATITKKVTSSTPGQALLNLEINLNNVGGGEIKANNFLIAAVEGIGDNLDLQCTSPNSISSSDNQFEILLENNKATISCFADLSFAGDLAVYDAYITLSYPYRLVTNTGLIKIQQPKLSL